MDQEPEDAKDADYSVRVAATIDAFTRAEWDSLGGTTRVSESGYNPFLSFDFLSALEDSGCAVRRTGWQGHHLRLETAGGRLLGAVPCYAKSHSQGEYVFDHGWADAFERAGGDYYPKLQCSVPFTPVTGPRLLVARDEAPGTVKAGLAAALKLVTDRTGVSSAHVTFLPETDLPTLEAAGFLPALWLLGGLAPVYNEIARTLTGASPAPVDYPETYAQIFDQLEAGGQVQEAADKLGDYLDRHDQRLLAVLGVTTP